MTNYKYVDSLARLTEIDAPTPDGGVTTNTYTDTSLATMVETKRQIDSSHWTDAFTLFDGLGQPVARSTANGEGTPWDRVDTCYDGLGRPRFTSYPYQLSGPTTIPNCSSGTGDAFTYDPLGRTTQAAHSDGNTVLSTYLGRATQVQDEGNGTRRVSRVSQIDGLGRLLSICEVSSTTLPVGSSATPVSCGQDITATGFFTTYGYDALSNLTSVAQAGLNSRSFAYDSFSRLISAANPESGAIQYKYDSDTNCASPNSFSTLLVSKLDARNIRTCMQYDNLNRLTQKNFSDGTPTANFMYDQTSAYGVTLANTIGRKSSETTASPNPTAGVFSYDQLGRVKINGQCTPLNCSSNTVYALNYGYDLLGDITSSVDGLGVTYGYTYNAAPRLITMTSNAPNSPATLYSAAHYNAAGALTAATFGNGIAETRTYDARLRLASITAGTVFTFTIPASGGYAPNSNILTANDSINGNWTYGYDDFNRLLTANATGQAYTYDYDRYGNRWHQNGPHSSQLALDANNRITGVTGVSYDTAGNTTGDGTTTYTYDAEGRAISVFNSAGGWVCYTYNAEGQRVRKDYLLTGTCPAPGSKNSYDYLLDLNGQPVSIIKNGTLLRDEFYAGNRHLGMYANSTTYFVHADHLGTERVRSSITGLSYQTCTSLPFGDWMTCVGGSGDPSPIHFTGKQHDSVSGLDDFDARYYSSSVGRFMTPDWSAIPEPVPYANLTNPQTLNLYAMVRDNPETFADLDGHCCDIDDIVNFAVGLANAYSSDNLAGAGRQPQDTTAGKFGAAIGDTIATVQGGLEVVGGGAGEVGGTGLILTGAGAPAGVLVDVGSAALIAHGASTATTGAANLGAAAGNAINSALESRSSSDKDQGSGAKQNKPNTRATNAEKNTLEGAQEQADSISKAKEKLNKTGQGDKIQSTEKSEQRLKNQLKKIQSLKDVED